MAATRIVESDEVIRQKIEKLIKDTDHAPWSGVPVEKVKEGFARWVAPRLGHDPEMFV